MSGRLLAIAAVFAPLSLATIGGGQTAIAGIRHQVVDLHHWMGASQFAAAFAISRMAPGPSSLLVTLIGLHVAGVAGAAVATLAMLAPTALATASLARLWARTRGARWQVALEHGLRPVAAGLILASVWVLVGGMTGWATRVVVAGATAAVLCTRVPPLVLLGAGALFCLVVR